MSNEFGFIYILTNPSMPGLVKIGKTTTTPNQRMSELHSTGVPMPFELEFSISVKNCHTAEIIAHKSLRHCRVTTKREFFRTTVSNAIEKTLESIQEYEIIDFKETHNIETIEAEVRRRNLIKKIEIDKTNLEIEIKIKKQEALDLAKKEALHYKLVKLKEEIRLLGIKPTIKEPTFWLILSLFYLPTPIGWIFWAGTLNLLDPQKTKYGLSFISLISIGYLSLKIYTSIENRNSRLLKPFLELEEKIHDVERELDVFEKNESLTTLGFFSKDAENTKNKDDIPF